MYFIVCFEYLPDEDSDAFIDFGDMRTFGFYNSFEECVKALNENRCDMYENYYDYAVVEEIACGIHPVVKSKHYFEFNKEKNGFFEIKTPEYMKEYFSITLAI